jgi:streptogramin lyase
MGRTQRSHVVLGTALAVLAGWGGASADLLSSTASAPATTFGRGDVLVSLRTGQVQWWHADGTLNGTLVNAIPGKAEGMGFDAAGNLYVTHYCADTTLCLTGNMVERFNPGGVSMGAFGGGYNCNPYAIAFDPGGRVYVGQADCTGDLLQFDSAGAPLAAFDVASDTRGSARIDLASDGCTMFYTSQGPNVKRYDVCARRQLPDFNQAPLPGVMTYGLRILPDGGVLVAIVTGIARLDSAGALVRIYDVPTEPDEWLGLDLVGDGTFWASNYASSDVVRFDLATGTVLTAFNTGTPTTTVKDVLVKH